MRGAFVVQLRKATSGGEMEGLVEEVDTGKQARFHSESELIEFLRKHFAQTQHDTHKREGKNEPKQGRQ